MGASDRGCVRAAGRRELAPAFPPPPGRARSREPGAAPGEAARPARSVLALLLPARLAQPPPPASPPARPAAWAAPPGCPRGVEEEEGDS